MYEAKVCFKPNHFFEAKCSEKAKFLKLGLEKPKLATLDGTQGRIQSWTLGGGHLIHSIIFFMLEVS